VCVGETVDSSTKLGQTILLKIDNSGKTLQKKLFVTNNQQNARYNNQYAHSLAITKNGDLIIGGVRFIGPYIMRMDTLGNIKWATWYYDSTGDKNLLQGKGVINSLHETSRGTIICAVGDEYPFNNGQPLNNYAVLLELDSLGRNPYMPTELAYVAGQFSNEAGYRIGGFYVDETKGQNFVLSGNESVYYTDSIGNPQWRQNYLTTPTGVGSQSNNVSRAKVLRDNTLMVAGQAYETDSWTRFNHLYYDAWWSPVDYASGTMNARYMTGSPGDDDYLLDFTQLTNGNLVFVGTKGTSYGYAPIWVFVMDSTGKRLLFNKGFFPRDSTIIGTQYPRAITATPDNGFTVVGYINHNGKDALAMHFVPKPVSAVVSRNIFLSESINGFNVHVAGAKLIVNNNSVIKNNGEASLFNLTGRQIAVQTGKKEIVFDISKLSHGTYFVRVKAGTTQQTMKIFLAR
jgi:hypothetical protein